MIGATRLEPGRLAAIARARGHSLAHTRAARVRAERKLATYLRANPPDLDLGDLLDVSTCPRRAAQRSAPLPRTAPCPGAVSTAAAPDATTTTRQLGPPPSPGLPMMHAREQQP